MHSWYYFYLPSSEGKKRNVVFRQAVENNRVIASTLQIFLTTAGSRNIIDVHENSSFVQISPFMIILKTHANIKSKKNWYPVKLHTMKLFNSPVDFNHVRCLQKAQLTCKTMF